MAEQQYVLNSLDNEDSTSTLCLQVPLNLTTGHPQQSTEDSVGPIQAELHVFGLRGETSTSFPLYEASPGEWEMNDRFELPPGVIGVRCIVNGEDDQVIHLGRHSRGRDTAKGDTGPPTMGKILDAQLHLPDSWESINIAEPRYPAHIQGELEHWKTLHDRFKQTGHLADISEAISILCRAVEQTPEEDVNFVVGLSMLGMSFENRFERTGDQGDLAEAISLRTRVVYLTPAGHERLPSRLSNLGNSFWLCFRRTGDLSNLAKAISLQTEAVDLVPDGHADKPNLLNNLGKSHAVSFERTGNISDIENAISALKMSVDLTQEGDAHLASRLQNLGNSFFRRFERLGDLADAAEAISLQTQAVDLTPVGHVERPSRPTSLGCSLLRRFERTGNLEDIAKSISLQTCAVDLTPEGHTELPDRLMNLGHSFLCRFDRTVDLQDIVESISLQTRAVHLTPEGHANLPARLMNLGGSFLRRFQQYDNLEDIAGSVSLRTRAVHLTPDGHAHLPIYLMDLGSSLMCRFERTGHLEDISESISLRTRAVHLTPDGHAHLPSYLMNLGVSFMLRFKRTGSLEDITESISLKTRAVHLIPEGHANLPVYLTSLASSLASRFESLKNQSDLSEAISLQARAVDLAPKSHAHLPSWLSNLGSSLEERFRHSGNMSDITEAILRHTQAIDLASEGHALLPGWHGNLGISFMARFGRTNDPGDGKDGISHLVRALQLTPEMHAVLPSRHNNLASAWFQHFTLSHGNDHLDAAISNFKSAATCSSGSPHTKLHGAIRWAELLDEFHPCSTSVLSALDCVLHLLTSVAGLEQTVPHRYTIIEGYIKLPVEAAATAFRLGRPDIALEWLEQGRCLVWGQQTQLRTPLDVLKAHNRGLADQVVAISKSLEIAGSSRQHSGTDTSWAGKVSLEDEALRHSQAASEWDHLLIRVREIPGFEDFLRPVKCSVILQLLPESGSAVVLTAHRGRCDAVVLVAGSKVPLHVHLPKFSLKKARQYQRELNAQLSSHHLRVRHLEAEIGQDYNETERAAGQYGQRRGAQPWGIHTILASLWNEVVKPILDVLRLARVDDSSDVPLARIWWCPTGPLSSLPFHAAGVYEGLHQESVMDYAVSSYTPTVSALTERVTNKNSIPEDASGLLLISQPEAPKADPIPGTTKEVSLLYDGAVRNGVNSIKLDGAAVSADSCPGFMEKFSSIHLACHASQNASNPLQSRFLFHDGHLTLNTIMQKNLKNADLAFLSACETSRGEEMLADEAVHLAAGMLAAGYRRVVATMWEISDRHAPTVANDFYEYLWAHRGEDSGTKFDGTLSAYALHHAIRKLRDNLDNTELSPLTWIPYVHFGY